jgi:hypothetical protein
MKKNGLNRVELMSKICSQFPNGVGVEVGTFKGSFSKQIIQNWNGTLYMVDVWRGLKDGYIDSSNHLLQSENVYEEAMKNIEGYEDRAVMIRASSEISAKIFNDNSLDFVYIDANHAYDYVVQDIKLWFPKVKIGGYILGHDYIDLDWYNDPNYLPNKKDKHIWNGDFYHGVFGVNPAVDEFCEDYGYELTLTTEWFGTWSVKKSY